MGLDLAQPAGFDHLDPHPVRVAAPLQLPEPGALGLVDRDDHLAADLCAIPWAWQYSTIEMRPAVHSRAFSEPGG